MRLLFGGRSRRRSSITRVVVNWRGIATPIGAGTFWNFSCWQRQSPAVICIEALPVHKWQAREELLKLVVARDAYQNLSWKLGFRHGKEGRPYSRPWWADRLVYALAYLQGMGIKFPFVGGAPNGRDYYSLIAQAVAALDSHTRASRWALYDRARAAQAAQFSKLNLALAEFDIGREQQTLEQAIRKVEAGWQRPADQEMSDAKIISDYAAFMTKSTTQVDCLFDVNLLPHSKEAIVTAIEREIVRSPLESYVEWLQTGAASLWNFLEGVGTIPLPLKGIDQRKAESFKAVAEREHKRIGERIAAAAYIRGELRADREKPQADSNRLWRAVAKRVQLWSRFELFRLR